jgi:uncharacterized protein YbbC (DUF1343 family)
VAPAVQTGLDVLRAEGFRRLRGRRLGVLCHAASVDGQLAHLLELFGAAGLDVRRVFMPEHGLTGAAQDMQPVEALPVSAGAGRAELVSLYGAGPASLRPPAGSLVDLDLLVADLQDVGCRYYTFAATLRYCLEACGRAGVAVLVLDRPNPLGGLRLEGPLLAEACRSFVGAFTVPVRHGLTLGELARQALREGVAAELEVVAARGWRRADGFERTGLPWVLPSPNMPSLETAVVYPGTCLLEATELSEGRGTTRPFELVGAPWLDGARLAREAEALGLPGVRFRAASFQPTFHKHAGRVCGGAQLHVTERQAFRPVWTGVRLLQLVRRLAPERFAWRAAPYEFVGERPALDLLIGAPELRLALERDADLAPLAQRWEAECAAFAEARRPWLLYPEEAP